MNDFIHVRKSRSSSNILKSFFNFCMSIHFLLHFLFKEGRKQSLNQKFLVHLDFILIFIFISRHISYFLLPSYSLHSSLKSFLFVFDGFLQRPNSLSPLFFVLIYFIHNLLNFGFGLNSILLGFPLLICFVINYICFRIYRSLQRL